MRDEMREWRELNHELDALVGRKSQEIDRLEKMLYDREQEIRELNRRIYDLENGEDCPNCESLRVQLDVLESDWTRCPYCEETEMKEHERHWLELLDELDGGGK